MKNQKTITLNYIISGDDEHDDVDFEYEIYYSDYLEGLIGYICETESLSREVVQRLIDHEVIFTDEDYWFEDEDFVEYLKDIHSDDAYEAFDDECEYNRDPWGYYGVSIHDFI